MPPEEAALRIEKMPSEMALQVLRGLKGKTADAILSQVKPDKAAKLTGQLIGTPSKISQNR
jgi:flagellar motility protein MotE (MotC chaperone)